MTLTLNSNKTAQEGECQHTSFNQPRMQAIVDKLWSLQSPEDAQAPQIASYQDFAALVPQMTGESYGKIAETVFKQHHEVPLIIGGTSGSTGQSKLVLERTNTPGSRPCEEDIQLVTQLRMIGALNPGDVAVNLFMVGMYSILHHGFNRLLEACYCSIIPLGSLAEDQVEKQLSFMQNHDVNVLVGTPGTLIQIAQAVKQQGITLNIERILFTGERMGAAKAAVLRQVFPKVRIIGCYGLSECGFVAIEQFNGDYQVRDDAYFLEKDEKGCLLVTSLNTELPTPVVRYNTGDQVELASEGTQFYLRNIDRSDTSFNFIGNLIDIKDIRQHAADLFDLKDVLIEVELSTSEVGHDQLVIKVLNDQVTSQECQALYQRLIDIEEFKEGLDKKVAHISVVSQPANSASLSPRNKHRSIIDLRG